MIVTHKILFAILVVIAFITSEVMHVTTVNSKRIEEIQLKQETGMGVEETEAHLKEYKALRQKGEQ